MQKWAASFYRSKAWRSCRDSYYLSQHGICQRCAAAGKIVHHIVELTPANINDLSISLGWSNLELLCQDCHTREHLYSGATTEGLTFDDAGDVVQR